MCGLNGRPGQHAALHAEPGPKQEDVLSLFTKQMEETLALETALKPHKRLVERVRVVRQISIFFVVINSSQ